MNKVSALHIQHKIQLATPYYSSTHFKFHVYVLYLSPTFFKHLNTVGSLAITG